MFPGTPHKPNRGERFAAAFLAVTLAISWLTSCTPPTPTTPAPPSATPAPPTATPEPMAATVNGEGIPAAEFQAQVAQYKAAQTALGKTVSDDEARKAVLDDLIAQVLLAQGARAAGFVLSDADLKSRIDALAKQLGGADKLAAWQSAHGYSEASFEISLRRAAEAAYMRDKIISAVPKTADQVHVQQILLYNENDAQAILNRIKGGEDFNTLAIQVDPKTHGDLSWFPRGYLLDPTIEQAAFSLQVGEVSEVLQAKVGFDIIKVLERDPAHPLSPDAYLVLQDRALQDWVAQQRAAAKIVLTP